MPRGPGENSGGKRIQDEHLREDAKQLLRVAYEQQVAGGGRVTQVDLAAGPRNVA